MLVSPAAAEDQPLCGTSTQRDWPRIQEIFTGDWLIEHQAGYAATGGMILPFPDDGELETITIWQMGDTLQATHPEAEAPLVLRLADEPRWLSKPITPLSPTRC